MEIAISTAVSYLWTKYDKCDVALYIADNCNSSWRCWPWSFHSGPECAARVRQVHIGLCIEHSQSRLILTPADWRRDNQIFRRADADYAVSLYVHRVTTCLENLKLSWRICVQLAKCAALIRNWGNARKEFYQRKPSTAYFSFWFASVFSKLLWDLYCPNGVLAC